jgi:hypothetical protein
MANDSNIMSAKRAQYLRALRDRGPLKMRKADKRQRDWAVKWGYVQTESSIERITDKGKLQLYRHG